MFLSAYVMSPITYDDHDQQLYPFFKTVVQI